MEKCNVRREPLLSVIVPVYNVEKYLNRCIDSIINQTYRNLEIIVVDDGSTDRSGRIAEQYSRVDKRIKVIHKENGGIVSSRKVGVIEATGEYLTQVDSDDWIESSMYEDMINIMIKEKSEAVTSGVIRDYGSGYVNTFDNVSEGNYYRETNKGGIFDNLLFTGDFYEPGIDMHIWNKIFVADMAKKYQLCLDDEIRMGDDCAFVCPYICHADKISVTHSLYYHYCIHSNSSVGTKKSNDLISIKKLYEHLLYNCDNISEYDISRYVLYSLLLMTPEKVFYFLDKNWINALGHDLEKKRIILFGAGKFGKSFYEVFKDKLNIIAWMDSNTGNYGEMILPVSDIRRWEGEYDAVFIGSLQYSTIKSMMETLKSYGVLQNKMSVMDHDCISKDDVKKILGMLE